VSPQRRGPLRFDEEAQPLSAQPVCPSCPWIIVLIMGLAVAAIMAFTFNDYNEHPILFATPAPIPATPSPVTTPTFPVCEPFAIKEGDPCQFIFTPTPLSKCPAMANYGICIYDGPLSLARPTATPLFGNLTPAH
jgi:hypothetical protein